jgi:hypothetical protein
VIETTIFDQSPLPRYQITMNSEFNHCACLNTTEDDHKLFQIVFERAKFEEAIILEPCNDDKIKSSNKVQTPQSDFIEQRNPWNDSSEDTFFQQLITCFVLCVT